MSTALMVSPLAPGSFTATEQLPANWELAAITCDDPDSSGDLAAATATFELSVADVEAQQPLTCTFTNCILELVLSGVTVTGSRTYEACDTITAGDFTVQDEPGGTDVTFRARNGIVLDDGFAVDQGAAFAAVVDPGL